MSVRRKVASARTWPSATNPHHEGPREALRDDDQVALAERDFELFGISFPAFHVAQ